jgi:hypothetical protein
MTGSPLRGYVENARRAFRARRNRSTRRARPDPELEGTPRAEATFLAARTS